MTVRMLGERAVSEEVPGFRPLYRQVRDVLVKRIAEGVWRAGQALPSEPEIAADLGVSQGTVRKALDEMTTEHLVVRRQGRGTFVAKHDDARIMFRFFKLVPDKGERRFPESRVTEVAVRSDPQAAALLGIDPSEEVLHITRVRSFGGEPCVFERIHLPLGLFPNGAQSEFPNNLYEYYAKEFGITIARASERLKAVAAGERGAAIFGVGVEHPLLSVERLACAIDGRRIEWRVSLCRTEKIHYHSELR